MDINNMIKDFDDFLNPEKIKSMRKDKIMSEYWTIIEKVVDNKRDSELSKLLFESDKVKIIEVVEMIDFFKDVKEELKDSLYKSIKIEFKSTEEES